MTCPAAMLDSMQKAQIIRQLNYLGICDENVKYSGLDLRPGSIFSCWCSRKLATLIHILSTVWDNTF